MKITRNLARWLALLALPLAVQAHATCGITPYNGIKLEGASVTNTPSTAPTWLSTQVYVQGTKVQLNGLEYEARWWSQGNTPGSTTGEVWKLTIGSNGIPQSWQAGQVYYSGEQTIYQGKIYTAKWWTKGSAPSGTDWTFVRSLDVFSRVQMSGIYDQVTCSAVNGQWYISTQTNLTINWSIAQDPDGVIAYWKQVDNSYWKTPAQGGGQELVRGNDRQGVVKAMYSSTRTQNQQTMVVTNTYSGASVALYMCTAANECRKVIGRIPGQN